MNVTCKICNQELALRSFAMHLRWSHSMKNEDYINQFGEFRPKFLVKENITIALKIRLFHLINDIILF